MKLSNITKIIEAKYPITPNELGIFIYQTIPPDHWKVRRWWDFCFMRPDTSIYTQIETLKLKVLI